MSKKHSIFLYFNYLLRATSGPQQFGVLEVDYFHPSMGINLLQIEIMITFLCTNCFVLIGL